MTTETNPLFSAFSNLQDGSKFLAKMMNTVMEESDKQVQEGVKWMNTLNEHALNNRNTAMKLWLEGVERSAAMTQSVMGQVTQAFKVQK
jgi:hypothetical protein